MRSEELFDYPTWFSPRRAVNLPKTWPGRYRDERPRLGLWPSAHAQCGAQARMVAWGRGGYPCAGRGERHPM